MKTAFFKNVSSGHPLEKILFRAFFKNNVIHPIKGCEGISFTSLWLHPRDIPQEVKNHTFVPFNRMIVSILITGNWIGLIFLLPNSILGITLQITTIIYEQENRPLQYKLIKVL